MRIGSVVIARCRFDGVGECEETMMIWSAEVDGDEGAMVANVDCICAAVNKRKMPSDEKIEFILCKHEMNISEHRDCYRYIQIIVEK